MRTIGGSQIGWAVLASLQGTIQARGVRKALVTLLLGGAR